MVATRNITDLNTLVTPAADDIMLIVDRLSATSTEAKQITWGNVIEAVQDIVSSLATDSTTLNFTYDDANGTLTAAVNNNTSIQKSIFHDGTTSSTRQEARFIDGIGVNVVVADDNTNDRANVTVKNTGLVNASSNTVGGTSVELISSVVTESDGSKTLKMRPLKLGSNKLSAVLSDSNQSLTLDINAANINLNDLDSSTPLGVSVGGTGASTAANARTSLGAAKSGANSDISALSGLTTALSVAQGGTGDTTASGALQNLQGLNSVVDVGASGQSIVHSTQTLVSGAYRAELRGIKPAAGNTITVTTDGSDIAIGANANNILDAVTGARNINGARITGSAEPINDSDLATRGYVNSVAQGLDVKEAVKVATTGGLAGTYATSGQTLTANSNGAIQVDGVTLSSANRVLLKDQSDGTQNGVYTVTTVGNGSNPFVLTRALDFNTSSEVGAGAFMFVESGTINTGKSFIQSVSGPTLDTTTLTFSVFGDSTLASDSVTNTKLANMVQATVKGRATSTGTGDPVDLSANQVVGIVNSASSQINLARVVTTGLAPLASPTFTGTVTIPSGASISGYATTSSLSSYATTASLSSYATTASLSSYATTASLSSYATTSSLSSYAALGSAQTFTAAQRGSVSTLSDSAGSSVSINFATANNFQLTLTGSASNTRTLANPSNVTAGQSGVITIVQSSNGGNLLTYGSNWDFSGAAIPLSTTANAVDTIAYYVISTTKIRAVLIKD